METVLLCSLTYFSVLGKDPMELAKCHCGYGSGYNPFTKYYAFQWRKSFSIKELDYVWGNITDLLDGKTVVVRDEFVYFEKFPSTVNRKVYGFDDHPREEEDVIERPNLVWKGETFNLTFNDMQLLKEVDAQSFKTLKCEEGKILLIGITDNGNAKIKLFKN